MSFIISQIIKKKLPEWNERILTEDDFYEYCWRDKVRVMESNLFKNKGEYTIHQNICFILLSKKLNFGEKLWVGFHELGHHLLHYPVPHRFSKGYCRRMDREANFFAAIALIPTRLIESKTLGEIAEEYNHPNRLIEIRKQIYDCYKI